MNNTSDEAFRKYWWNRIYRGNGNMSLAKEAWEECRHRCEAQIEERERKALEFGVHNSPYSDRVPTEAEVEEVYRAFKSNQSKVRLYEALGALAGAAL